MKPALLRKRRCASLRFLSTWFDVLSMSEVCSSVAWIWYRTSQSLMVALDPDAKEDNIGSIKTYVGMWEQQVLRPGWWLKRRPAKLIGTDEHQDIIQTEILWNSMSACRPGTSLQIHPILQHSPIMTPSGAFSGYFPGFPCCWLVDRVVSSFFIIKFQAWVMHGDLTNVTPPQVVSQSALRLKEGWF